MLSTKNTLSQIEVIKSFKRIVLERETNNSSENDDEYAFEFLFYMLFFFIQLSKKKIELIKLYYDTILLLFNQIKDEKKMIKFINLFTNCIFFPFYTVDIAKYLLDNFSHPIIRLEGYKILKNSGCFNELLYYLLKNESFSFTMNFIAENFDKSKMNDIKKVLLDYLNKCKDNNQIRNLMEEYIQEEE